MKKYTIALIWLTAIGLIAMVLFSCSASNLMRRAIKKGAIVQPKTEYVTTTDTIRINGKDSIITVRVPVQCPEIQIPPTRQEIRYKYKIQRDSIKTVRYVTKWKTKEVVKVAKNESKNIWNWFWIGVVSAVVIILIWKFYAVKTKITN